MNKNTLRKKLSLLAIITSFFLYIVSYVVLAESADSKSFMAVCQNPNDTQRVFLEKLTSDFLSGTAKIDCDKIDKWYVKGLDTGLSLQGDDIEDITIIRYFTKLKRLVLTNNRIKDVTPLANLTNLEHLSLYGNPIEDISALSKLTKLKDLSVASSGNSMTLKKIGMLSSLVNLESLHLKGIIDNLEQISQLIQLRSLTLTGAPLKKKACNLKSLINIESLALTKTGTENIDCLADLSKLIRLSVTHSKLSDISVLRHFPNLEKVNFMYTDIANIEVFERHKKLTSVDISNTNVTDTSVLSRRGNMRYLATKGAPLKSCAPKNSKEANKGYSCTNPDGTPTSWWKRMWQF